MKKPDLNSFGKKLKLNKRNINVKSKIISEKELFLETMDLFFSTWDRSNKMYEIYKINTLEYEESFYQIIENCLLLKYEAWKVEILLWYIFGRFNEENKVVPFVFSVFMAISFILS